MSVFQSCLIKFKMCSRHSTLKIFCQLMRNLRIRSGQNHRGQYELWFTGLYGGGGKVALPLWHFWVNCGFLEKGEIASYLYSMSCLCKTSVKSPSRLFPNPPKCTNELHSLKNSTIFSLLNLLVLWHTLSHNWHF